MLQKRILGTHFWSLLSVGVATTALPACGGETGGLGPADSAVGETSEAGDAAPTCSYATSFVVPSDGAQLTAKDDHSGKNCANGLITDVSVATSAPDGTPAQLFANDQLVSSATVSKAKVLFASVALPSKGPVVLRVTIGGADCQAVNISVDCGLPACSIAAPKGPYLNGMPVASGGDRVDNATDPFATKVAVSTDLADGEFVTLSVDGNPPQKVAAAGGQALFPSVTMAPDGSHTLSATCTATSGNAGNSGVVQYTVVTAPVDLTLTKPVADGTTFGVASDVDPATPGIQFDLCGTTTDPNAINVPADARNGQNNLCAGVGTATPSCASMATASGGGGSACVRMTCPTGSAPFDVNVTLSDKAGNIATAKRANLRCESTLPSVSIVSPGAYIASNPATILNLAAGEPGTSQGSFKKTVVACTDKFPAKAQLYQGYAGSTLSTLGPLVDVAAAVATDNCPSALGYVARFTQTLSESIESKDGKGTLASATELRVDVTDSGSNLGSSPKVDLWIDSVPPQMQLNSPHCGKVYAATANVTDTVSITSDTIPLTFKVAGSGTSGTYPATAFDTPAAMLPAYVTIPNVTFYVGGSDLSLTATDAAGNPASALSGCKTYVGTPPVVAITSPANGAMFGADANVDPATHDYKTTVTGTVTGSTTATSVTLKLAGVAAGTAPISSGAFTFSNVMLPESDALAIEIDLTDANYGPIATTETVVVDTHPPTMSGSLAASVDAPTRRAGGFDLSWTAGSDYDPATGGTRNCDHYDVRRAAAVINSEATWTAATVVSNAIAPTLTSTVAQTGRLPASSNFAVRCVDKVGNLSPIIGTTSAATADFIQSTLAGPAGVSSFGHDLNGGVDLNGDGVPDIVVGTLGGQALVYFGHVPTSASDSGFAALPSVTFSGSGYLGASASELDDFDGDGKNDLVVGAPLDGTGKAFIISGVSITASSTPIAVSSLTSTVLTITGDSTSSLVGNVVRNSNGFFGSAGSAYVRAKVGGYMGFTLLKSRPIAGGSLTLPANADFFVQPASSGSALGLRAAFQDVDGDGLTDVLTGDSSVATVYLFKGRTATSSTPLAPSAADGTLTSSTPTDLFGQSVGLPGKITGTRFDAVIGASNPAGRVDVVQLSGTTMTTSGSITDATIGAGFGNSTLQVQPGKTFDADRDGIADIVACTITSTASASMCNLTYGANPFSTTTVTAAAETFPVASSTGVYVSSIGDIDGDGFVDFMMCSPGAGSCLVVR